MAAVLLGISLSAQAQDLSKPFRIFGSIEGLPKENTEMYFQGIVNGKAYNDTVDITDDKFTFQGNAEPARVRIYCKRIGHPHKVNPIDMFIDEGDIKVTAVYDTTQYTFLRDVKIEGSKTQDEYGEYIEGLKRLSDKYNYDQNVKDYNAAKAADDTATMNRISKVFDQMKAENYQGNYIHSHPNSFVALDLINNFSRATGEYLDSAKEWFRSMSPELQFSANGQRISRNIAYASKGELIGKPAPTFTQTTNDGRTVNLSDYKGKYLLLDFWASWCGPCRAENPNVLAAYKKYHDKGFDVLAVSLDTDRAKWEKAIKEDALPWTHISDLQRKNVVMQMYGVSGIPDNFLISPDGIVIARALRGEQLDLELKEIFEGK